MIKNLPSISVVLCATLLTALPAAHANINHDIAKAYNEGVVRCSNAECAKYLYACFRSYSSATLQEFLACGSQASTLNGDQKVVSNPTEAY